ncbi:beta-lactamase/transpeptidase-like protein [Mollisia scopiformis]|uniref:Beta-lactamase/transpeptidase-like protein n=1 Tax=Mollisia scopiformis TaxID=149040 RepID=A0A194X597_MOLSC|nr:beta-lactamase/transpeptidase-like protein [Mollisia scopiformis]KUJ15351.1 beta-lactamase/transpeptidase-like protein [Mollisia scopiformis]
MLRIAAPRLSCSTSGDVSSIIARLKANEHEIDRICQIAGIAGASVGVIHEGEVIYKHHHGFQNIAAQEKANDDTLYGIGSCSKPFFAAVIGSIVSEGKLKWDEPLKNYLPMLATSSKIVTECSTLVDVLGHRTGLTGAFHTTFQGNGDHLIGNKDFWAYLPTLAPAASFRERWIYNSHGYSIAGELLTQLTGKNLTSLLQEHVNKALGLTRTITELDFDKEPNFAKPYSTLEDGTPYELKERQDFRGHFFEAAAGLFKANLDAMHTSDGFEEVSNPIKEGETLFSQHIPVLNPSFRERSYALGWIRTQLPEIAGVMGDNIRILGLDELPIIGEGTESRLLLYHQGATVGYFPSLYQFPELRSGIVVLTNSIALGDQADWIAQSLTQGDYWDAGGLFYIQVRRKPGSHDTLRIAFQGLEKHAYDLRHYHDDVFEWTLTRNETAKRARYHMFGLDYFLMQFKGNSKDIDELAWHDDGNLHNPRVLKKSASSAI